MLRSISFARTALTLLCIAATAGCRANHESAAARTLNGPYVLKKLDGHTLPDTARMLGNDGMGRPCGLTRTDGKLVLDSAAKSFALTIDQFNQCNGMAPPPLTVLGTYAQRHDSIYLVEVFPERGAQLKGAISSAKLAITGPHARYEFSR